MEWTGALVRQKLEEIPPLVDKSITILVDMDKATDGDVFHRNGRDFIYSLAQWVRTGRRLTPKQREAALKYLKGSRLEAITMLMNSELPEGKVLADLALCEDKPMPVAAPRPEVKVSPPWGATPTAPTLAVPGAPASVPVVPAAVVAKVEALNVAVVPEFYGDW